MAADDVGRVQRAVGVQASVASAARRRIPDGAAEDDFSVRLDGDGLSVEEVLEGQPQVPRETLVDAAVRQQPRDPLAEALLVSFSPWRNSKEPPTTNLAVRLDRDGFHLAVSLGRVGKCVVRCRWR